MKKVLFIADGLGSGGAERQMVTVARLLKSRGFDVSVLCYSNGEFNAHLLVKDGISITWMIEPHAIKRMWKVRHYIRNNNFDAVISFLETPNFLNNFSAIGLHKWKVITGERSSKDSTFIGIKHKIFIWFQRYSDYIVCNSENARKQWMQNVSQYAGKVLTIPNAVVLDKVNTEYVVRSNGKTNIVVAASHQYLKNAMGLVKALVLMSDEQRQKLHINWYGEKNKLGLYTKAFEEVNTFVQDNQLNDVIEFFDPTDDLANCMQQADVVALFSKVEGLPNTICEGMAIGKPIIMTRVSDYDSLVSDTNGFLCDWDNIETIKDALCSVVELSDDQLRGMGYESKSKARSLFSKDVVVEKWSKLIG